MEQAKINQSINQSEFLYRIIKNLCNDSDNFSSHVYTWVLSK